MYLLLKIASIFFCALPREWALSIGRFIGYMFFLFSRKKKAQALKNLRLAFPKKPFSDLLTIARKSFTNFGMSIIESLRIPKEDKRIIGGSFVVEGKEYLSSIEKEKGIFTSIHMGSWELFNISLAKHLAYVVLARRQSNAPFDAFLNRQRRRQGLGVVYEDDVRSLINYLKKDYVLGIVFDHGARDSKIYSKFFGKLIPVPVGPLKLALKFQRKLYPACLARLDTGRHLIKIFAPLEVRDESQFQALSQDLNRCYEGFLRRHPEDYLWWYKRFKRSKNLNILVLSDAKAGHLRQSLSLAKLIKEKRPESTIETVEIKLSYLQRLIFDVVNIFSPRKCRPSIGVLRVFLGRDFDRIFRYADAVISCGASLSSLNSMLSHYLNAKSFVIQRPNVAMFKHDLVIVPFHDNLPSRRNIVRTSGSLSFHDEQKIRHSAQALKGICGDFKKDRPKIGVFIGGPLTPGYRKESIFEGLSALKKASDKNRWQLFITTSRRTPKALEDFLAEHFSDEPLLIIANRKNYGFVAGGILGLCDLVLVSSDSVSMITEAASASPTLVYDMFAGKRKKHAAFVSTMARNRHAKVVGITDLEETIKKVLDKELVLKRIDDRAIVDKALDRKL